MGIDFFSDWQVSVCERKMHIKKMGTTIAKRNVMKKINRHLTLNTQKASGI